MTVEEKRSKVLSYCNETKCDKCELNVGNWECYKDVKGYDGCLHIVEATEKDLDKALSIIYHEDFTKIEAPSEEATPKHRVTQVDVKNVLANLMYGHKVFRVNLDKMAVCDLCDKSINCIRRDLDKPEYIYFIVEEV